MSGDVVAPSLWRYCIEEPLETLRFQGSSHIHRARRHRFARFLQGVLLIAIAFGVQCLAAFVQIGVVQVGRMSPSSARNVWCPVSAALVSG